MSRFEHWMYRHDFESREQRGHPTVTRRGRFRSVRREIAPARSAWRFAALVVALIAAVSLPTRAHAGAPTVDANANANVSLNGQVKVDIDGLDQIVGQIDGDLARLLRTTQTQARGDIEALLGQTRSAINDQLAQIRSASAQAVNQVAGRVDAQLKAVLEQAQALHQRTLNMILEVEHDIQMHAEHLVQGVEQQVLVQLQQIHKNILDTLQVIGQYVDEQLDRLYVRTDDGARRVAVESRVFVDSAALTIARGVLGVALLVLLMRVVRQASEWLRKRDGLPVEPIVGAAVLLGVVVLLASKSLLSGALGVPAASSLPDACENAWTDYGKFFQDKQVGVAPDALRYRGVSVEEELKRCAYLSVSQDRIDGAEQLIAGLRSALAGVPGSVGAVAKK
jgi:hypothetical protein